MTSPSSLNTIIYSDDIEAEIAALVATIEQHPLLIAQYHPRWLAIQLLEGDETLLADIQAIEDNNDIVQTLQRSQAHLQATYGADAEITLIDQRYRYVHHLAQQVVSRPEKQTTSLSDRVDKIVTNQYLGIPLFLLVMWLVFKFTTDVTDPFIGWVEMVVSGPITRWVVALITLLGLQATWVESLLVDGIIAGVGGVLVFVPVLTILYVVLAILEDSGYMARAAFVMDRFMKVLGLHGKSFVPMMVGFGCTVPALAATRTLENDKDRILTGLLVPFMSCGARLPVYVLLATIFFPRHSGLVIFGIYVTGIVVAMILGVLLKHTLFKDKEQVPFIMELSSYRRPSLKNIWFHTWNRLSSFLHGAATMIMIGSMVIWLLVSIPVRGQGTFANTPLEESAFAWAASGIAPLFVPTGSGLWNLSGPLITGIIAKEMIVSTMSQLQGMEAAEAEPEVAEPTTTPSLAEDVRLIVTGFGSALFDALKAVPHIVGIEFLSNGDDAAEEELVSTSLAGRIQSSFDEASGGHGPLAALAFMMFVLLYTPCMPSLATERQELGDKWMWITIIGQFVLAWFVATLIFQGGLLLGV